MQGMAGCILLTNAFAADPGGFSWLLLDTLQAGQRTWLLSLEGKW